MQTVIHEYANLSPIFNDIETVYMEISSKDNPFRLLPTTLDTSFVDLYDILKENVSWCHKYRHILFEDKNITHINVPESNNMIVCISGGKDSVALAKYYMDEGYNVYLYHMHGINKVYPDEVEAVKRVAEYLNLPLYIENVTLKGTQDFVEHPMKNYIIANGAIHYAIREHLGINIAFGNFNESYLVDNDFAVCAGDCMDMWYAYEKIIRRYLPQFTINIPFKNNQDTIDIIENDPELLGLCVSCMSPYRFRQHWKKRTEDKYGVYLLPNRCGCCWKCASEYITYTDLQILDLNVKYYVHCLEILYNTKVKESNIKTWSLEDIWSEYFFYPMSKSRAYKELKNAVIHNGKVQCITQTEK